MAGQYYMSQKELKELQNVETELLQEIDRICKKCGIHYNMVGGTMLGAVRHKGFIPWDDDADIGLLRKEYEKFREACKTELDTEKYYFQDIHDTKGYRWGYGKLRKKNTKFVRLGQEDMPYDQGCFVDVFPFDNVPDNKILRKLHLVACFVLRKFLWSKVGYRTEKNKEIRFLYWLMHFVPEKILVHLYDILAKVSSYYKTEMVRILVIPTPKGTYGFYRKWYSQLCRYQFDTISLFGAKDYDGYLTHKYGNYMQLPPENKKEIHPISELKLD